MTDTTLVADLPVSTRFEAFGPARIDDILSRYPVPDDVARSLRLSSAVLPFRVNSYVLDELVDWSAVPDDPMFALVFPGAGMLPAADEQAVAAALQSKDRRLLTATVARIRAGLNPHPSAQRELNVPHDGGQQLQGLQHKYARTVLYFPQQGQTCHAYCTYCFRWAQFVGDPDLRFAAPGPEELVRYLRAHPEVHDVLVTGGDPMVMSTERLRRHIEPLLTVGSLRTVRIGTKSVAYWPHRFVSDPDADDVLALFSEIVASGRTLAVMAHYSCPRELDTPTARAALARILSTGARVYCQAPLIAHVNDDADVLARLWTLQMRLGAVPYYAFVARDTGPHDYYKIPLVRAHELVAAALRTLPGLARTLRGPVMSATPGKIVVDGPVTVAGEQLLALRFLQARDPGLAGRPFLARAAPGAAWADELSVLPDTPPDIAAAVATA